MRKIGDLNHDVFAVALMFGANDAGGAATINRNTDPLSPPPMDETAYHPAFDRSPVTGPNYWTLGEPDGTIDLLNDVFGVAFQFGHDCT